MSLTLIKDKKSKVVHKVPAAFPFANANTACGASATGTDWTYMSVNITCPVCLAAMKREAK